MWKKPDEIVNCKSFTSNFLLNFFLIKRVSHIQIFLNHYFSALSLKQTIICFYIFFLSLNSRWFMTRFTIHSFNMFLSLMTKSKLTFYSDYTLETWITPSEFLAGRDHLLLLLSSSWKISTLFSREASLGLALSVRPSVCSFRILV